MIGHALRDRQFVEASAPRPSRVSAFGGAAPAAAVTACRLVRCRPRASIGSGAPNSRLLNLNKATKRHFASSWP